MDFLPFEMGYLTEDMKLKAEKELGETDEIRTRSLIELRNLVEAEENLTCSTHDSHLLQYLRAKKFNVKRAFHVLRCHYKTKNAYHEFETMTISELVKVLQEGIVNVLPQRDQDGCAVMIIKYFNWNHKEVKFSAILNTILITALYCALDPATQVCGMKVIIDLDTASLVHLRYIPFRLLHLLIAGTTNLVPIRLKAIHILNGLGFFKFLWNFIKYITPGKILKRYYLHSNSIQTLHEFIPPEILPKEYDGYLEDLNSDFVLRKLEEMRPYLLSRLSEGYAKEEP